MYILPWHDVIVSGNFSVAAGTAVTRQISRALAFGDQPDRSTSSRSATRGIDTLNKIDVRVGKLFRFEQPRASRRSVDFDNLTNADTVWQVRTLTPRRRRSPIRRPAPRDAAAVPVAGPDPRTAHGGRQVGLQILMSIEWLMADVKAISHSTANS